MPESIPEPNSLNSEDSTVPWSQLFASDALSKDTAILVTIFAATVASPEAGDAALTAAVGEADGEMVLEALFQVPLFAGFPRGINALASFRKHFGDGPKAPAAEELSESELRQRGLDLFRRIYAENSERVSADLDRFHPDLGPWIISSAYGGVLSRPQLDPARRELCAIAALIVSGDVRQLSSHLRGALHCGASPAEARAAAERAQPFTRAETWQKAQTTIERTLSANPGSNPNEKPNVH